MSVLRTDPYLLTMVAGYFHQGRHDDRVTFELFVRGMPAHRRYLLFAGLDRVVDHLSQLRFDDDARVSRDTRPALRLLPTPEFVRDLASGRLDETEIARLRAPGAPIDASAMSAGGFG